MPELVKQFEDVFITDSMPLKICQYSRSKICKENDFAFPDIGYCPAQKLKYYGYKLHAVCSLNGVIQSFDISPASVHDVNYLKDIGVQLQNCTLIGNKGYISAEYQIDLFNYANIQLNTPHEKQSKRLQTSVLSIHKEKKEN